MDKLSDLRLETNLYPYHAAEQLRPCPVMTAGSPLRCPNIRSLFSLMLCTTRKFKGADYQTLSEQYRIILFLLGVILVIHRVKI